MEDLFDGVIGEKTGKKRSVNTWGENSQGTGDCKFKNKTGTAEKEWVAGGMEEDSGREGLWGQLESRPCRSSLAQIRTLTLG